MKILIDMKIRRVYVNVAKMRRLPVISGIFSPGSRRKANICDREDLAGR